MDSSAWRNPPGFSRAGGIHLLLDFIIIICFLSAKIIKVFFLLISEGDNWAEKQQRFWHISQLQPSKPWSITLATKTVKGDFYCIEIYLYFISLFIFKFIFILTFSAMWGWVKNISDWLSLWLANANSSQCSREHRLLPRWRHWRRVSILWSEFFDMKCGWPQLEHLKNETYHLKIKLHFVH